MKKVLIAIAIFSIIFVIWYLIQQDDFWYEPTHTMTEAEMEQVCREEGIPLD